MNVSKQRRVHGFISGRVQGVFFRASMRNKAAELDVAGWVKNRRDGRVEFIAEGKDNAVQQLIEWARTGPPHARVTGFEVTDEMPSRTEERFRIRR